MKLLPELNGTNGNIAAWVFRLLVLASFWYLQANYASKKDFEDLKVITQDHETDKIRRLSDISEKIGRIDERLKFMQDGGRGFDKN